LNCPLGVSCYRVDDKHERATAFLETRLLSTGQHACYGIIGDPIAQVKSPRLYSDVFAANGADAVLIPIHIRSDQFAEAMPGLLAIANLDGLLVTIPFKMRVIPLAQSASADGRQRSGAVNALRREADGTWSGDMFDGIGLVRGLRKQEVGLQGTSVTLVGAGGAGSAVGMAIADAGAARLRVLDIEQAKAVTLVEKVARHYPGCRVDAGPPDWAEHQILVNATPVGMRPGDGTPIELDRLKSDTLVVDIIVKPDMTPLIARAKQIGCRTLDGRVMLEGQVEEVLAFFGMAGSQ
jgi:shikimate dehydrogenase